MSDVVSELRRGTLVGLLNAQPLLSLGIRTACEDCNLTVVNVPDPLELPRIGVDALLCVLCHEPDWQRLEVAANSRPIVPILALFPELECTCVERALTAGVTGALAIASEECELVDAITALLSGRTVLPPAVLRTMIINRDRPRVTTEELEWLRSLAGGATVAELASRAAYSERQLYRRLKSLYERLGVSGRAEALLRAQRTGLLE